MVRPRCEVSLRVKRQKNSRSENMQRIVMAAAALLLGAGLAASTAKADMNYGPVVDKGLCFQKTNNADVGTFGYWTQCAKPAAAAASVAPAAHHRHSKHS